ncbi:MAG: CHASE2 domain-containing protein, partial [Cyanobacteria bacterium J06635_10]
MLQRINRITKYEIPIWRRAAIPGLTLILIIIIIRLFGGLQFLEWMLLDTFLRIRPSETTEEKVIIIGINEKDIQKIGRYPVPDREIAALIKKIQSYQPRVIGLDIFKNVSVEPGSKELLKVFKESKNIIGVEKFFEPDRIAPPPVLSPDKVGFVDIIADKDGKYRRYLLLTYDPKSWDNVKFSLALHLAEAYLSSRNINIENGIHNPDAVRFGATEIPVFESNSGGYIKTDDGGIQMLMNFRNGKQRFRILSLHDIKKNKFNRSWLQNKIVLIGVTATSTHDFLYTSAISGLELNGKMYGVEYHAQATSQIINAVLNKRPLLRTWSDKWEYGWIIVWGLIPI